jgi:hypothetical protein
VVILRDGPVVALEALRLVWTLEERGCVLRVDADQLFAGPRAVLTDDDRQAIRRWRDDLIRLVAYCDKEHAQ